MLTNENQDKNRILILYKNKGKEIIKKIAEGLPNLSEFDKGYFLGIVEAKADKRAQPAIEPLELVAK